MQGFQPQEDMAQVAFDHLRGQVQLTGRFRDIAPACLGAQQVQPIDMKAVAKPHHQIDLEALRGRVLLQAAHPPLALPKLQG